MLIFRAGIHLLLVRIAHREDPEEFASADSDLGLHCLSRFGRHSVFEILEHFL